jgi:ribonuclease R
MAENLFAGITIDAEHSRDLDDAIRVEREGDGWYVEVCVPRIDATVPRNSTADIDARELGFTRYNAFSVRRSMLDPVLIEEELTLAPGNPRSVLVMRIQLDSTFAVKSFAFDRGRFESMARLSHEEAGDLLASGSGPIHDMLVRAWTVAVGLLAGRRRSGSITWFSEKSGVVIDEDGRPVFLDTHHGVSRAYLIVQEFMILANSAAAEWCVRNEVPIIFRNQRGNPAADRASLTHDLELISIADPQAEAASDRLTMMLGRATLGRKASGHFALGLPVYAWFSSPIRRYADLVNQRAVIACIDGEASPYLPEELAEISDHLNELVLSQQGERGAAFLAASEARARRHHGEKRLSTLSTTDMTAVIRQAKYSGVFSSTLVSEIEKRLANGTLTAKDKGRIVIARSGDGSREAQGVFFRHLEAATYDAVSVLSYLEADREIASPSWTERMERNLFSTEVTLPTKDGLLKANGRGETKKAAAQRAAVGLLASIAGYDWEPPTFWAESAIPDPKAAQASDAKGGLITYCQANRLPPPSFQMSSEGPSHAPKFTSVAAVGVGPTRIESAPALGTTKKDAEQKAAAELLTLLKAKMKDGKQTEVTKNQASGSAPDNAKTLLQEVCQKRKWSLPSYDCSQSGSPPVFFATAKVTTAGGMDIISERFQALSKKAAEKLAAENLLAMI